MNEYLIPVTLFLVIGLVMGLFYYFRYRSRAQMQETVRVALDKGQELSAELIDRLGEPRKSKDADLRKGIMGVFIAIGVAVFGYLLGEDDATRALLATAALPFMIGLAYLLLWRLNAGKD